MLLRPHRRPAVVDAVTLVAQRHEGLLLAGQRVVQREDQGASLARRPLLQERYGDRGDRFSPADLAEAVTRRRLHAHAVNADVERLRDRATHRREVWPKLRLLGDDGRVQRRHAITGRDDLRAHAREEIAAARTFVPWILRRAVRSKIA